MWRLATGFLLAAMVAAGIDEGKAALKAKDYATAKTEFTAAAEAGDAEAQYQLGEMFRVGLGMNASPRLAKSWYEKAEAQGHAGAAGELGFALWKAKKRKDAVPLLRKGADGGHPRAAYCLALAR